MESLQSFTFSAARRLAGDDKCDDYDPYAPLKGDLFAGDDAPEPWRLFLTFFLILTLGSLAAGAGIGGGGLFVPIYAVLLDVGAKPAVPLSKCTILGAAIGNYVTIGFGKHPNANRPIIDYETSTFMQAGELLGVTFGVLLNLLLPEIVIMVFLMLLLSYNSVRTLRKGRDKYRKETLIFELEERRGSSGSRDTTRSHASTDNLVGLGSSNSSKGVEMVTSKPLTEEQLHAEYLHHQHASHTAQSEKKRFELEDFLKGVSLGHLIDKFVEYGVESLVDLLDDHIVNSSSLASDVGVGPGESKKLLDAIAERRTADADADLPDFDSPIVNADELSGLCAQSVELGDDTANAGASSSSNMHAGGFSSVGDSGTGSGHSASLGEGGLRKRKVPTEEQNDEENGEKENSSKVQQGKEYCLVQNSDSPELKAVYAQAARQFPAWAYLIILGMTAFTVIYAVIKRDVLNPCAGPAAFWIWNFSPVLVLGAAMVAIAKILNAMHVERERLGYRYQPDDIQFSKEQLNKFPVTAINAGVAAGLLGIGGGMVIGPLFIEIGMQPQVGTASCAFMILWTATSGVVQYAMADKLGMKFAATFAAIGFVSGQLGQRGVNKVLAATGRPSIVVLLLGAIIGLACIVMTGSTALKLAGIGMGAEVDECSDSVDMWAFDLEWSTCSYAKHH